MKEEKVASTPNGHGLEALSPRRLEPSRRPLEQAYTLPAEAFTSSIVYEREVERLFAREWLCAGRVDQIPDAGDYFCLDLLGEKLVVVRGRDDEVRVLSRICRHRAAEVVTGSGNTSTFVCRYHAWAYQLDGRLAGAPLSERIDGFDTDSCRLPEIRSELWQGWIFVNFDESAAALGPPLEPLSKLLAPYAMGERVASLTARFDSPFNWKVLVDNFMEAYHHIATHRDTLQPLFPAALSYVPDNDGPYSALVMPHRPADGTKATTVNSTSAGISASEPLPVVAAVENRNYEAHFLKMFVYLRTTSPIVEPSAPNREQSNWIEERILAGMRRRDDHIRLPECWCGQRTGACSPG